MCCIIKVLIIIGHCFKMQCQPSCALLVLAQKLCFERFFFLEIVFLAEFMSSLIRFFFKVQFFKLKYLLPQQSLYILIRPGGSKDGHCPVIKGVLIWNLLKRA